jgi:hypothetical protein
VFPVVRDVKDMRVTGWCAIAGTATLIMLGFFCAALFLWMAEWSGPIVACLMLGGIFLLIMIMAAIVFANVRRRRAQRARLAHANAAAQWWRDPAVIATGLQIDRTLGVGGMWIWHPRGSSSFGSSFRHCLVVRSIRSCHRSADVAPTSPSVAIWVLRYETA